MVNANKILNDLIALRHWCAGNLPIENSYVAYDLLLIVAEASTANRKLTVKNLFNSAPHSYTAVRMHYKRLVNDGWFELVEDEQDRRVKYVVPTKQFIGTINNYLAVVKKDLGPRYYPKCDQCTSFNEV
ncbi:hypothetical protein MCEKH45_00547 [Methylophilaceae bacterium]